MTLRRDPDRPVTRSLSEDGSTIIVHIPMKLRKRGGRKLIVLPETQALPTPKPRRDDTLLKAVGRAYRWRRMIEAVPVDHGPCRAGEGHAFLCQSAAPP